MKKSFTSIVVLAVLSLVLTLGGCLGAGTSSTATNLGADQPTVAETTQADTPSSENDLWLSKLQWQANWLWSSYITLKTKVDATKPDMVSLCANAWEMVSNLKSGNLSGAFAYFLKAKDNISAITKDIKE